jgi:hypothetical protein
VGVHHERCHSLLRHCAWRWYGKFEVQVFKERIGGSTGSPRAVEMFPRRRRFQAAILGDRPANFCRKLDFSFVADLSTLVYICQHKIWGRQHTQMACTDGSRVSTPQSSINCIRQLPIAASRKTPSRRPIGIDQDNGFIPGASVVCRLITLLSCAYLRTQWARRQK